MLVSLGSGAGKLHGKGGHCSLCKKKQRKLERETKETKQNCTATTVNVIKKNKRQNNKHPLCFPVVFWFLISVPQEIWLYLPLWSLTQLGVLRTNPLFLHKLIWKDFCYFSNKQDQIKNKQRRMGKTFMPIKKHPLDTQRRKKITLLLKAVKEM